MDFTIHFVVLYGRPSRSPWRRYRLLFCYALERGHEQSIAALFQAVDDIDAAGLLVKEGVEIQVVRLHLRDYLVIGHGARCNTSNFHDLRPDFFVALLFDCVFDGYGLLLSVLFQRGEIARARKGEYFHRRGLMPARGLAAFLVVQLSRDF